MAARERKTHRAGCNTRHRIGIYSYSVAHGGGPWAFAFDPGRTPPMRTRLAALTLILLAGSAVGQAPDLPFKLGPGSAKRPARSPTWPSTRPRSSRSRPGRARRSRSSSPSRRRGTPGRTPPGAGRAAQQERRSSLPKPGDADLRRRRDRPARVEGRSRRHRAGADRPLLPRPGDVGVEGGRLAEGQPRARRRSPSAGAPRFRRATTPGASQRPEEPAGRGVRGDGRPGPAGRCEVPRRGRAGAERRIEGRAAEPRRRPDRSDSQAR